MRFAGIRFPITSAIPVRVIIIMAIETIDGMDAPTMATMIEMIGVVIQAIGAA
jgi:hypothetical protein